MEDRFKAMVKMRDEGKSILEIAAHFEISKQRVSELFISHNIPLRQNALPSHAKIPDSEIIRIANPEKIAETHHITLAHARLRMKRLGLTYRTKKQKKYAKFSKQMVADMYKEYEKGLTQKEVAEKFELTQSGVSSLFRRFEFKTRKNGWPEGKPRKYF